MLEEYGIGIGMSAYFQARHVLTYVHNWGFFSYWTGEPILRRYGLDGNLSSLVRIDRPVDPVTIDDRNSIIK